MPKNVGIQVTSGLPLASCSRSGELVDSALCHVRLPGQRRTVSHGCRNALPGLHFTFEETSASFDCNWNFEKSPVSSKEPSPTWPQVNVWSITENLGCFS